MSKKIEKIISITTSVATIVAMSGIATLIPLAANATISGIADGATVKTADSPDVYIVKYVGSKQFKRLILNPQVFDSYGHLSWGAIKTVSQATMDSLVNSNLVREINDTKVYQLIPNGDVGTKQWMNMTAEQFTAGGYDWDSIYIINEVDRNNYTTGTDVCSGSGCSVTPPSSGTLAVSLAASTALSGTVVDGQSIANLASFNFTAPSNSAVKVTTFKAKRIGVSADTTLTNVYLYDGVTRLTDSASVSSGVITWNNSAGIFTIPAGTTKVITIKSDIDGTAGETVGVAINAAADIVTDGATVTGSFPINGNYMSVATATLATVDFGTITPSSDGTPAPQNEFTLWQSTVTVSTRAVNLSSVAFRQIGSVNNSDLANFKLFIDGVQVGSTVSSLDSNGYVTFDLTASPKKLEAGSRVVKVLVDLVGGSTRTTSLSLRYAADINVVDSQYGVNILATVSSAAFSARTSTAQTIAGGTITFTKTIDSAAGSVVLGATNQTLAKFEVKAAGESMKIETLDVAIHSTTSSVVYSLRNGALYANGVQIGSTAAIRTDADATPAYTRYNLGSSLIVAPGTPVILEVRADIFDDYGTNDAHADDSIRVDIQTGSNNAQKMTSLSYTAAPSATVSGNYLTIQTGSLSLAKYTGYGSQSAVPPQTAYKMGEWRLTANTTENVNLTSFEPDWVPTQNTILGVATDLSDMYITYADKTTSIKSAVASTTDSFSINYTLPAGQTISVALYATILTGTLGNTSASLTVRGTTALSAATADSATNVQAQTITWTTGSISAVALESPLDQVVYGGQTIDVASYQFTAVSDAYQLNQFAISVASGAQAAIDSVWLYDGTTLLNPGGTPMNVNYATTTGLSLNIPANTSKTITVKLKLNSIGTGGAASGLNASTTMVSSVVYSSGGTPSYVNPTTANGEGNAVYVFKTYPTVTMTGTQALTVTNDSAQPIYKFTITPSAGGMLALKQFKIDATWQNGGLSAAALELEALKVYKGGADITSTMTIVEEDAGASIADTTGAVEATSQMIFAFTTEEQISAATEYVIYATPRNFQPITSTTSTDDYVVLTISAETAQTAKTYVTNRDGTNIWSLAAANTGAAAGDAANFIWSDRNLVAHAYTSGSSSADWFNGYKIKFMPLNSATLRP